MRTFLVRVNNPTTAPCALFLATYYFRVLTLLAPPRSLPTSPSVYNVLSCLPRLIVISSRDNLVVNRH
jgi:hypothetical protein